MKLVITLFVINILINEFSKRIKYMIMTVQENTRIIKSIFGSFEDVQFFIFDYLDSFGYQYEKPLKMANGYFSLMHEDLK